MNRRTKLMLLAMLVLILLTTTFANESPTIIVNNKKLPVTTVYKESRDKNKRVLVPLRAIFESLNATVHYDHSTKIITGKKDGRLIILTVNDQIASVDGEKVKLDVPATVISGNTFVPVRFIGESLGAKVEWFNPHKTIRIDLEDRSTQFTKEEIGEAIKVVEDNFGFPACTLTKVWYNEKESDQFRKGYLESGKGSVNRVKPENVIVLLSNFDVDDSGDNPVLNPGSTYWDYQWILIRDNKTSDWKIDDWGY